MSSEASPRDASLLVRQAAPSVHDLIESTHDGVFVVDGSRRIVLFNSACERLTGYHRDEIIGSQCRCFEATHCRDEQGRSLTGALCPGIRVFAGEAQALRQRMRLERRDGSAVWVETVYTPLKGRDGAVACVLATLRDVSEQKAREDGLRTATENLREEVERLRGEIRQQYGFSTIVSRSEKMRVVFDRIKAACNNDAPVLIMGEAGTGRELIARTIHHGGLQKDGPFVALSCSALLPETMDSELFGRVRGSGTDGGMDHEGLIRAADAGTLLIEELTAMPLSTQARLMQVLEYGTVRPVGGGRDQRVDVRFILSAPPDAEAAVARGTIRQDLFHRLAVIRIEPPPLRERMEDVPFLTEYFIAQANRRSLRQVREVDPAVWAILTEYDWPGNVRELLNAIESSCAVGNGPVLTADTLPRSVSGAGATRSEPWLAGNVQLDEVLADVERRVIVAALRRAGGSRSKAAREMAVSRSRLYRRMEVLGIKERADD